jgi:hypothetical protein
VLKWARENGAPWDEETRELAASKGYVETLADDARDRERISTE